MLFGLTCRKRALFLGDGRTVLDGFVRSQQHHVAFSRHTPDDQHFGFETGDAPHREIDDRNYLSTDESFRFVSFRDLRGRSFYTDFAEVDL